MNLNRESEDDFFLRFTRSIYVTCLKDANLLMLDECRRGRRWKAREGEGRREEFPFSKHKYSGANGIFKKIICYGGDNVM